MRKVKKYRLCALLCGAVLLSAAVQAGPTRTVHYYDHLSVTVPEKVTKVATSWEAENSILTMLGAGDKIVATTRVARSIPLLRKYVPSITHAP